MVFKKLMLKNIKYNIKNYISNIVGISCILSILFMFSNFLYSDVFLEKSKEIFRGPEKGALIVIVAVLLATFVIYIIITFTKTRGREIGVYYVIGFTSKEILRILAYEDIVISIVSSILGLFLGIVFSKLFNMIFLKVMDISSIDVALNINGFKILLLVGLAIFLITFLYQKLYLMKYTVVQIIKDKYKKEMVGKCEFIKGLIAFIVLLLSGSKEIEYIVNSNKEVDSKVVLIGIISAVSLYFFVGLCIVLAEKILKIFKKTYNSNIIVINTLSSRFLAYRTTIFVNILLISLGLFLITEGILFRDLSGAWIEDEYKSDLSIVVNKNQLEDNDFKSIIGEYAGKIKDYKKIENVEEHYIQKNMDGDDYYLSSIRIISNLEYNSNTKSNVVLKEDETITPINERRLVQGNIILKLDGEGKYINRDYYIKKFPNLEEYKDKNSSSKFIEFDENNMKYEDMVLTNASYENIADIRPGFLVVNDNVYSNIKKDLSSEKIYYDILVNLENNKDFKTINKNLREELKSIGGDELAESLQVKSYLKYKEVSKGDFIYFIFIFLGAIFLIGSSLILYFKIFTSLDEDRERKNSFIKLGLTSKEIKKIIFKEISIIFLVPAILSVLITSTLLNEILNKTNGGDKGKIIMFFVLMSFAVIYFVVYEISKHEYFKRILNSNK